MDQLTTIKQGDLISFLHGKEGAAARPFERDIFLDCTFIAGVKECAVNVGDRLQLFRDVSSSDPCAIEIRDAGGKKAGNVPQFDSAVFARLMDAGKHLFCTVAAAETRGGSPKIKIKIFLHE